MCKSYIKTAKLFIIFVLIFQMIGCGTLLYPERRGQRGGRIDPAVAILDGVGLLLFIIPGLIAFAVDFSTGAIYLPGTASSSLDVNDMKQVKFDPENAGIADIERIVAAETGLEIRLDRPDVEISELKSIDDMMVRLAEVLPETHGTHTAMAIK